CKKRSPALQETSQRAEQRDQIMEQAGVSRGIAEPHRVASHSAQSLAAENQPENESDAERCEDSLDRILAHVLLAIFLQRASTIAGITPDLFGLVAILLRHRRRSRLQVVGHHAGSGLQFLRSFAR